MYSPPSVPPFPNWTRYTWPSMRGNPPDRRRVNPVSTVDKSEPDAPVSGSDLSTVETGFTRLRSGGLPLIDGHVYRVQFGKGGTDGGEYMTAQLVSTE